MSKGFGDQKIETIFGPRECGIECIPDARDYQCSYSKLSMSPGSLTPLEEDKSLDLTAFMDEIGYRSPEDRKESSSNLSSEGLSWDGSTTEVFGGGNGGFSGLPIPSSPTSEPGSGDLELNPGSGTKAIATSRTGLRQKVTGVSSPLTQCVATWENVADPLLPGRNEVQFEGDEDHETPMSPVLMRAKDSLLLRDVRKKKRTASISSAEEIVELMSQIIEGIPVSTSALRGAERSVSSDQISTISLDLDAGERVSLLDALDKTDPSSPNPFRSPPSTPLTSTTYIQPPDTPTIRPSTRTVSGSRDLDDAISPLQLSSPTITNVRESAWVQAPLAASISLKLDMLRTASDCRQQQATFA